MADIQVQDDTSVNERERLTGELQATITNKEATELEMLKWDISWKAQKEFIDHLTFIPSLHMDKHPIDFAAKIYSLPGECGMEVKPASLHAPKVILAADTIVANDPGDGEVADDLSVVV